MVWRYIRIISPIGMMYAMGDMHIAHAFVLFPREGGTCWLARNLSISLWSYATLGYKTMNLDVFMRDSCSIHVGQTDTFIDHDKNVDPNTVDGSEIPNNQLGCQNLINSNEPKKTTYLSLNWCSPDFWTINRCHPTWSHCHCRLQEFVSSHDADYHRAHQELCMSRHCKCGLGIGQVSISAAPWTLKRWQFFIYVHLRVCFQSVLSFEYRIDIW